MQVISPKPDIQKKLESWVAQSPTQYKLDLRLSGAAQRRETELNKVVARNCTHLEDVKKALTLVHDKDIERNAAIREKQLIKFEKAIECKENQHLRYAKNMERKMEKIRAIQAKEMINQPVQDENGYQRRLIDATGRKRATLTEIVLNSKAKQEKVHMILQDNAAKVALAQKRLNEKLTTANKRKEENLKARVLKASEENTVVAERAEGVRKKHNAKVLEIQTKHENKLESATKRKELGEFALNVAHCNNAKQEKVHMILQDNEAKVALAQKRLYEKLSTANKRKEENLKARVLKASEENTVVAERAEEVRKKHNAMVAEIQTKHENKLESATKRKENNGKLMFQNSATKKIERAKSLKISKNADLSSIRQQLEFKLTSANERKELTMQIRAEKAAEENKAVLEKVQNVQQKIASNTLEIQSKHENKLESATKRKEMNDERKNKMCSIRRVRVVQVGERLIEDLERHKENLSQRLNEAAARRERLLKVKVSHCGQCAGPQASDDESNQTIEERSTSSTLDQLLVEEAKPHTSKKAKEISVATN